MATEGAACAPLAEARTEEVLGRFADVDRGGPEFFGALFDAGVAWVHHRVGEGGLGAEPGLQTVVDTVLARAGVPSRDVTRNAVAVGMAAPTIAVHGTPEQRQRFLRPAYAGEELWCQLFSEPGAGSDLAAVATRAERDGDDWVVNGQKVWTTLAHISDWAIMLARTDPTQPKHRGLTFFLVDMASPGIEVRALRQLTGDAEFNEVYLSDVRVPDAMRLGDVGKGWQVAMTTLSNERIVIAGQSERGSGAIHTAVEQWRAHARDDAVRRDELMQLWIEAEVVRLTNIRAARQRAAGTPGPEGSIAKLAFAELRQRIYSYTVESMGAEGMLYDGDYLMRRPNEVTLTEGDPRYLFLRSRANSIEGGTSEVLRNILGERTLGLPLELRVDRDTPWKELPR